MLRIALIALVTLTIAWQVGAEAIAGIVRVRNPAMAERLTGDPQAPLYRQQLQLSSEPRLISDADIARVARTALRSEPLSNVAIRNLAMHLAATGDARAGSGLAMLAERITRRDLMTQIMLIELSVQRDDTAAALQHYDRALRTSAPAKQALFPVLSRAIEQQHIQLALVPYVRDRAVWMPDFIRFAMNDGQTGPRRAATLILRAGAATHSELMADNSRFMISWLVERRDVPLARLLASRMSGFDAAQFARTGFTPATTAGEFGSLAWTAANVGGATAVFEGSGDRRVARVFAGAGQRAVLLRRILALPPGAYRLFEQRTRLAGDAAAYAFWEMRCPSGASMTAIWRGPSDRVAYSVSGAPGPSIPANCPYQQLELTVSAGAGQDGVEFTIEELDLRRQ